MNELLKELRSLPGVVGTFVYATGIGLLASDMPSIFRDKSLLQIGKAVDRAFKMNDQARQGVVTMKFKYEESLICVRRLDKDAYLISICEPTVNQSLIKMTAGVISPELKSALAAARQAAGTKAAPAAATATATVSSEELLHSGPLAPVLNRYQEALARAIGPVSQLVLREAIGKWVGAGGGTEDRLPELIDLLCVEIGDSRLEAEFRAEITGAA